MLEAASDSGKKESIANDDEVRISFRWGNDQYQLVRRAAELIGVPYQTYIKQVLYRQSMQDAAELPRNKPFLDLWFEEHRRKAEIGVNSQKQRGFMEARIALQRAGRVWKQTELRNFAEGSTIHTFGWPIGVVMRNVEASRPKPTVDGILAEVTGEAYQYWSLRNNLDFFVLEPFVLEDSMRTKNPGEPERIYISTRIIRMAETLLYYANLCKLANIPRSQPIEVRFFYKGLKDRLLLNSGGLSYPLGIMSPKICFEDSVFVSGVITLSSIEDNLVAVVKELAEPLFNLFDFSTVSDSDYTYVIENFKKGKCV